MPIANPIGRPATLPLVPVLLTDGCGVDLDRPVARAAQDRLRRHGNGGDIRHAVLRQLADGDGFAPPIVLTGPGGLAGMTAGLPAAGPAGATILEMPGPRGTATAVAAAARLAQARHGACLLLVLPCDILAQELLALGRPIVQGARLAEAEGAVASIGIRPWATGIGFDHIATGPARGAGSYAASRLVAGAGPQEARELQADGAGYWNSGTYILPGDLLLQALATHDPALLAGVDLALAGSLAGAGPAGTGDRIVPDRAPLDRLPATALEATIAPCLSAGAMVAVSLGWGMQAGSRSGGQWAGRANRPGRGADPYRGTPAVWRSEVRFDTHVASPA